MSASGIRQPFDSFAGPINEARAASTAGGGTALSTTAAIVGLIAHTTHVSVVFRNFSTAVVAKFAVNPYLLLLKSADGLVTTTDYSAAGQKNTAVASAINLSSFAVLPNAFYIGSHVPFRGVAVTMSASVNANASTLSVLYWNGSTWVTTTPTDGTASAGATFAQTGNITFTVPTDWAAVALAQTAFPSLVGQPTLANAVIYSDKPRYWLRLSVSAALSASTAANTMFALNRSTAYAEMVQDSQVQFRARKAPDGIGCLEMLTDAGTANAIVNCYTDNPAGQF